MERYKKILDSVTGIAIYVVREDTHELLYYNKLVEEVAPHVRLGAVCHELWK